MTTSKLQHWRGFQRILCPNALRDAGFGILMLCALGGCALAPPTPPSTPQPIETDALQRALDRAVAERRTPGASLWVERAGASVALHSGRRTYAPDAAPVAAATLFDIASLTKVVVTATAVQLLIDEEALSMDRRLVDVLPECAGGGRDAITLTHLLTHTSGLPAGIPARPAWTGKDEALRRACAHTPGEAPGTAFRYSDVNFILLGAVVERIAGEPLDTFAARRIFAPLGMMRTGYRPLQRFSPGDIAPTQRIAATDNPTLHIDLAPGAELVGVVHDPTARFMGGVAGHAGLFSTAEDLARFVRMLLAGGEVDGRRFLSRAAIERLRTAQSPPAIKERRSAGWDVDSPFSRPRGLLFSPASFGHTGFTGCAIWVDPPASAFYILLTNRVYPDEGSVILPLYAEFGTLAARAMGVGQR